ncbi:MAG: acetyl-CoA carboxylase biotin carboxyl carrier protein subunit, partial [Rhodothalassiaceae bacterium]
GFIDRHGSALLPAAAAAAPETLALATLGVLAARHRRMASAVHSGSDRWSPWRMAGGWRLNLPATETQTFVDPLDETREIAVRGSTEGGWRLAIGEVEMRARILGYEDGRLRAEIDGHILSATVLSGAEEVLVIEGGRTTRLRRLSSRFDPEEDAAGPGSVSAPMPGKVLDLFVAEGDAVERGTPLLVLEAMKMEHMITAPRDGRIRRLGVSAGAQVDDGAFLVEIAES